VASAFALRNALDEPMGVNFDPWQLALTLLPGGEVTIEQELPDGGFFSLDMAVVQALGMWVFGWPEGAASLTVNGYVEQLRPRPGEPRTTSPWPGEECQTPLRVEDSRAGEQGGLATTPLLHNGQTRTAAGGFLVAAASFPVVVVRPDGLGLECPAATVRPAFG
jgi:hypothetical protein